MIKIKHRDREQWKAMGLSYVVVNGDEIYGVNRLGERIWINWRVEDILGWAMKRSSDIIFIDEDGTEY